jgi:hypothetical protein
MFLISYNGYHWIDSLVTSAGGIGAIGLTLCPTTVKAGPEVLSFCPAGDAHGVFVALFFISMIVLVVCIFTRSAAVSAMGSNRRTPLKLVEWFGFLWYIIPKSPEEKKARSFWKKVRDYTYMLAGLVITVAGLLMILDNKSLGEMSAFWFETAAILAFGVAWLFKGKFYRWQVKNEQG